MEAISKHEHFVIAGSIDNFNAPFVSFFDLAVHITVAPDVRKAGIHERELAIFGDMYKEQRRCLDSVSHYETDGSPSLKRYLEWAVTLPCKVFYLNGEDELIRNVKLIVEAYMRSINSR